MVTKRQLLVYTRYYKGENECPERLKRIENGEALWEIERDWVNDTLNHSIDDDVYTNYCTYAFDKVPSNSGYPVMLLAYLFYRQSKWSQSLESCAEYFPTFLKKYYGV